MLIEAAGVVNTGDAGGSLTASYKRLTGTVTSLR